MNSNAPQFQLVDNHGRTLALRGSRIKLGRSNDNQIVVQDSHASRHHATIFVQAGRYYIQDEGSMNGTWLNAKRITGPQPLQVGDRVRIGTTEFVVQLGAAAPVPLMRGGYAAPERESSALPYVAIGCVAAAMIMFLIAAIALSVPRPVSQAQVVPTPIISSPVIPTLIAPTSVTVSPAVPSRAITTQVAPTPVPTATSEPITLPTLPPPLAEVDFPAQAIDYPYDWPQEIRYPSTFKLVGAASGLLPDGKTKGWSAKLVYSGPTENAKTNLSSFFIERGWRIVESSQLDSDGWHLFLQRNNNSQKGTILVGPDIAKPGSTRILVTILL